MAIGRSNISNQILKPKNKKKRREFIKGEKNERLCIRFFST